MCRKGWANRVSEHMRLCSPHRDQVQAEGSSVSTFSGHVEGRWVGDRAISIFFKSVWTKGVGESTMCLLSPKSIFEFTLLMSDLCLTLNDRNLDLIPFPPKF